MIDVQKNTENIKKDENSDAFQHQAFVETSRWVYMNPNRTSDKLNLGPKSAATLSFFL